MGGGRKFHYPKWVWSPAGGWWPNPANAKRNAFIWVVGVCLPISYSVWQLSERKTVI